MSYRGTTKMMLFHQYYWVLIWLVVWASHTIFYILGYRSKSIFYHHTMQKLTFFVAAFLTCKIAFQYLFIHSNKDLRVVCPLQICY